MQQKKHAIPVELIKESVSIQQVLELFSMKKSEDRAYCCPWHDDKTASLKVVSKSNNRLVHCFGCGRTGDVVELYMALAGQGFHDSLKELSEIFLVQTCNSTQYNKQREQKKIEERQKKARDKIKTEFFIVLCDLEKSYKSIIALGDEDIIEVASKNLNDITYVLESILQIDGNPDRLRRRSLQYREWRNARENVSRNSQGI